MKFIPAKFCHDNKTQYICTTENKKHAVIAQLVEWKLPKLQVASSSLVYRSQKNVARNCMSTFLLFMAMSF